MSEGPVNPFVEKHWPILLAACGGLILWYTLGQNTYAGMAGFLGIGWLAWEKLIKPGL